MEVDEIEMLKICINCYANIDRNKGEKVKYI